MNEAPMDQQMDIEQMSALLLTCTWATCTECGAHFSVVPRSHLDATAARERRAQKQAEVAAFAERMASLSPREREITIQIAKGFMPAEIASMMRIDPKTVATYRCRILEKLDVTGTAEIAIAAHKAGLLG